MGDPNIVEMLVSGQISLWGSGEIVCRDIILLPDRRERGLGEFITEQI